MKLLNVIALSLFFVGCQKSDTTDENDTVPACIIEKSKQVETCTGSKTDEYKFQGKLVYLLDITCCCDYQSPVFDANCAEIGALGGIAGVTSVNGVEFFSNAVFVRNVWKK
jgi:hypothetical protein